VLDADWRSNAAPIHISPTVAHYAPACPRFVMGSLHAFAVQTHGLGSRRIAVMRREPGRRAATAWTDLPHLLGAAITKTSQTSGTGARVDFNHGK